MKRFLSICAAAVLGVATLSAPAWADETSQEPISGPVAVSEVQTPPEPEIVDESPAVVDEVTESVPDVEPVEQAEPDATLSKGGDEHVVTVFCHKPGEKNQQTLSTDDDGFLQGHLGHGDTLGECPPEQFVPYQASARWLLPATWDYDTTPSYQAAIFPQDVLTGDVPACRWSQDDIYLLENPAEEALFESLDDDGVLTQGEDSAIYASHVFTAGPPCEEEVPTYTPTCTTVTDYATLEGDGVLSVDGDWGTDTYPVPFSGTLADIGTVLDIQASPLQYVGLHIALGDYGTLVFEEEPSYGGSLWSNSSFEGVNPGMGYNAFGSIEEFIHLNGSLPVTSVTLLYTHPEASSTEVFSFTVGCTTYDFEVTPPPMEEPTEEPTPQPTPTQTAPVVVPTVTPTVTPTPTTEPTPVVAQVHTASTLAATGSDGVVITLMVAGLMILAGFIAFTASSRRKRS